MKNKPLSVQIWYVLAGTALGIFLILFLTLPAILNTFFTKETYNTIEHAQKLLTTGAGPQKVLDGMPVAERQQELQNIRAVQHVIVTEDGRLMPQGRVPASLANKLLADSASQTSATQRYEAGNRQQKLYYIATKLKVGNRSVTLISFMLDTYQRQLSQTLYKQLILLMGVITAISWLPSIWMSRYLSKPLVKLQQHVKRIAERNWREPIAMERKDEIGQLSESVERMREQLVQQDENQQSMLQHISHELKTPVMVIQSYAQSILDGVYPKGDLEGSVRVIESEAQRLDKRIRDLLYLTKLDYLSSHSQAREPVELGALVQEAANRLRWRKPELEWSVETEEATIPGDAGQLTVAIENLLDNQIRYAHSSVNVSIRKVRSEAGGAAVIRIANDGPAMEPDMAGRLFQPFEKGKNGEFGLGMSIVQRVVAMHQGEVQAVNEPPGVAFYIRIPAEMSR